MRSTHRISRLARSISTLLAISTLCGAAVAQKIPYASDEISPPTPEWVARGQEATLEEIERQFKEQPILQAQLLQIQATALAGIDAPLQALEAECTRSTRRSIASRTTRSTSKAWSSAGT